jgi:hypothetical protein
VGVELERMAQLDKEGITYQHDFKPDRKRRVKGVFHTTYNRDNLKAALAELLLLGELCLVDDQWKKRNKVKIGPETLSDLSKRIQTAKWSPTRIKRYVNVPDHSHDVMGKELNYPWLGQVTYEFDPLDLIVIRYITRVSGSILLNILRPKAKNM